jgi:hypothetical protein
MRKRCSAAPAALPRFLTTTGNELRREALTLRREALTFAP